MAVLRIFTDGGARGNPGPAGIGVHVIDDSDQTVHQISQYIGETTNNVAEYMAVIKALEWLSSQTQVPSLKACQFFLDSMLVVEQVNGKWKIKEPHLQQLNQRIQKLRQSLPYSTTFQHVRRAQNSIADKLVNEAVDQQLSPIEFN